MLFGPSNIAEIDGPVTFWLYELEYIFFKLTWIQLINQKLFEKYDPAFPKNH